MLNKVIITIIDEVIEVVAYVCNKIKTVYIDSMTELDCVIRELMILDPNIQIEYAE
jgi:hypothetical protein